MPPFTRLGASLTVAALSALAVTAGGCGDEDEPTAPNALEIKATGPAKTASFSVPKSVPAGVTRIEFVNAAEGQHSVQLARVDAGHTPQEANDAALGWVMEGKPLPPWIHLEGGVPSTGPGTTAAVTQELAPGKYLAVDTADDAEPLVGATFTVTGDAGEDSLPSTDARIETTEYGFRAEGLKAGRNTVLFDNKGREPHFIEAVPIKPDKTIADVRRFADDDMGEPPVEFDRGVSSPVLDGRRAQVLDLNLQKGRYALLCFVPDRKGGPPHAAMGMVSEVVVE